MSEQIHLGDFVSADLIDIDNGYTCQGVFVEDWGDGRILVRGEGGENYVCWKNESTTVPDGSLLDDDTFAFVNALRRQHSLDWYGSLEYPRAGRQ